MRRRTLVAAGAAGTLAAAATGVGIVGAQLGSPALHAIGAPPPSVPVEDIQVRTTSGAPVRGWLAQGRAGAGVVLLLHGVRADRRAMNGRALFLHRLGYTTLAIDLPAHGESPAPHITYGVNEALGVQAALRYLEQRFPAEHVGVIGVSLGAASLVLSRPDPAPNAVVLESMYPTIAEAVADRLALHVGRFAEALAPLLLWQLPLREGVSAEQLRPIAALPDLHAPVLIAAGAADRRTTLAQTRRLFAAANAPKTLWIVDGAAHVDLHAFDPAAYEARITAFFATTLRSVDPVYA